MSLMPRANYSWYFAILCSMEAVILENFPLISHSLHLRPMGINFLDTGLNWISSSPKAYTNSFGESLKLFAASTQFTCMVLVTDRLLSLHPRTFWWTPRPMVLYAVDTWISQHHYVQNWIYDLWPYFPRMITLVCSLSIICIISHLGITCDSSHLSPSAHLKRS